MKKDDLAKAMSEITGYSYKESKEIVNIFLEQITDALVGGEEVDLFGFGKFEVKERAGRTGINPSTKERIEIPSSKSVSFKAAKNLKQKVNN